MNSENDPQPSTSFASLFSNTAPDSSPKLITRSNTKDYIYEDEYSFLDEWLQSFDDDENSKPEKVCNLPVEIGTDDEEEQKWRSIIEAVITGQIGYPQSILQKNEGSLVVCKNEAIPEKNFEKVYEGRLNSLATFSEKSSEQLIDEVRTDENEGCECPKCSGENWLKWLKNIEKQERISLKMEEKAEKRREELKQRRKRERLILSKRKSDVGKQRKEGRQKRTTKGEKKQIRLAYELIERRMERVLMDME